MNKYFNPWLWEIILIYAHCSLREKRSELKNQPEIAFTLFNKEMTELMLPNFPVWSQQLSVWGEGRCDFHKHSCYSVLSFLQNMSYELRGNAAAKFKQKTQYHVCVLSFIVMRKREVGLPTTTRDEKIWDHIILSITAIHWHERHVRQCKSQEQYFPLIVDCKYDL